MFPTRWQKIQQLLDTIDPKAYSRSRNYLSGKVTRLSPYISRGILSTRKVFLHIQSKGVSWDDAEKLIQELAWRDYFQRVWQQLGDSIFEDIRRPQHPVAHHGISSAIVNAKTGIAAIDKGITALYEIGYMHNHMRMYVAMLACNIAQNHWLAPARWMYAHLLDADWASNALSWQWVAGTFSAKKYVANQENINRYTESEQHNTFLDVTYDALMNIPVPEVLKPHQPFELNTSLPKTSKLSLNPELPLLVYTPYNLSPEWKAEVAANRVLILEPSFFKKYPVTPKVLEFWLELSKNITAIQWFVGDFHELQALYAGEQIYFKEHPTNRHFLGIEEERDWLVPDVEGFYPSFFSYWNKINKRLKREFVQD